MRIVQWLRENGHDAIHLRGENLHRLPNGEINWTQHSINDFLGQKHAKGEGITCVR